MGGSYNRLHAIKRASFAMSLAPVFRSGWLALGVQRYLGRFQAVILAAMLAALYPLFMEQGTAPWQRMLFVLHLGLFLLWQPMIERHREVSTGAALFTLGSVGLATLMLNGWLLLFWLILLAGVVGGKVLLAGSVRLRLGYLAALAYLIIVLLVLAVPAAMPDAVVVPLVRRSAMAVLLVLLLAIVFLPPRLATAAETEVLDLVNSVIVVLLLSVLVLGTLSMMLLFRINYVSALLQSLFGLAGVLLALGWVWSPHFGYAGLQSIFSRHLLSIGVPAQQWLEALADLTLRESHPERFFTAACAAMADRVSWIRGMAWQLGAGEADRGEQGGRGMVGQVTGECADFVHPGVQVKIYTRYALPPSVSWHMNLLIQLLAEFYADKQRAQRLREMSYLRAVHETGARLTHDVKNLLQSMQTLIYAADYAQDHDTDGFRDLMRRQLPAITTRLSATLEKLRAPQLEYEQVWTPAAVWWDTLRQRYSAEPGLSVAEAEPGTHVGTNVCTSTAIPDYVFTAVLDNLLANLAEKRAREPGLQAQLALTIGATGAVVTVSDNGSAIPDTHCADLLRRPVNSANGLGIGLYQSAQLAGTVGYELVLTENRRGSVVFVLRPA